MGLTERSREASLYGVPMKHVSLITLMFQNSALILIMHYSRIMPLNGAPRYFTSTAVLLNEVIKLTVSLTIALYDISVALPPSTPATVLFDHLYASVFSGDGWKLAIPAALYTLQNSLQYIAVSNLDAVHFQILYQLKILTTALFSVLLLHRPLTPQKWLSLLLLTLGVIIVQLPSSPSPSLPRSLHAAADLTKRLLLPRSATYEGIHADLLLTPPPPSPTLGLLSVLLASLISGLTGVYFEKVLKTPSAPTVTVWTRNAQLSFYSLLPAILGVIYVDGAEISRAGFFAGYNGVVCAAVGFQALGGVLVALCINYADNIAKNFATGGSIVLSVLVSVWFFDFGLTWNFLLGTATVIAATYLYASSPAPPAPSSGRIVGYERTTIDDGRASVGTSALGERRGKMLDPMDLVQGEGGRSSSRPGSPMLGRREGKRDD